MIIENSEFWNELTQQQPCEKPNDPLQSEPNEHVQSKPTDPMQSEPNELVQSEHSNESKSIMILKKKILKITLRRKGIKNTVKRNSQR